MHFSWCLANVKSQTKILFWNSMNSNVSKQILELWHNYAFEILILVEYNESSDIQGALNSISPRPFLSIETGFERRLLLLNEQSLGLDRLYLTGRIGCHELILGNSKRNLLVVHGPDKRNHDTPHQLSFYTLANADICRFEDRQNNSQTIVIGDFNVNPFESSMTQSLALNAVSTEHEARLINRNVLGSRLRAFYNPMWSRLGDRSKGPPGTYFNTSKTHGTYGWNMLDQVIFRESSLDLLSSVKIFDHTGVSSLASRNGRPLKRISDHFPLLVTLSW